jgi:hypothetical protein
MNSIFISYRRQDAAGHAGRLFDRLVVRYGDAHVFMDHHDLPPGVDFATAIESNLMQASVVLAVMGPHWIDARDADGRPRLAQPEDFVRRELLSALAAGKRVIPVLVGGAQIPAEEQLPTELAALVRLQACELRDSRFDDDLKALLESLPGEKGTGTEKGTDLFSAAENKSVPFLLYASGLAHDSRCTPRGCSSLPPKEYSTCSRVLFAPRRWAACAPP